MLYEIMDMGGMVEHILLIFMRKPWGSPSMCLLAHCNVISFSLAPRTQTHIFFMAQNLFNEIHQKKNLFNEIIVLRLIKEYYMPI